MDEAIKLLERKIDWLAGELNMNRTHVAAFHQNIVDANDRITILQITRDNYIKAIETLKSVK